MDWNTSSRLKLGKPYLEKDPKKERYPAQPYTTQAFLKVLHLISELPFTSHFTRLSDCIENLVMERVSTSRGMQSFSYVGGSCIHACNNYIQIPRCWLVWRGVILMSPERDTFQKPEFGWFG